MAKAVARKSQVKKSSSSTKKIAKTISKKAVKSSSKVKESAYKFTWKKVSVKD
jgi:hypothetical protein